jgi:hypothetical protein
MLIAYLEPFEPPQHQLLLSWAAHVRYWPRSYAHTELYNAAIPVDWWLLFSNLSYADMWCLRYPEHSRIIRTLLD